MARSSDDHAPLSAASFHVLLALAEAPLHGYGLMQKLRAAGLRVGPGTIYGALSRMEQSGWVEQAGAEPARGPYGKRHRYALTREGRRVLRSEAHRVLKAAELLRAQGLGGDL